MKNVTKNDSPVALNNRIKKMQECYNKARSNLRKIKDPVLKTELVNLLAQMKNILKDYGKPNQIIKSQLIMSVNLKSEFINLNDIISKMKDKFGKEIIIEIIGPCC